MFYSNDTLRKKISKALSDKTLHDNLDTFFHNYKISHQTAYDGLNFSKLKKEIGKLKNKSSQERLKLFDIFKENVEKTGAIVYQAKDSKEACRYIASVCKKHNAEYVVKSKSMTAEEIGLNPYLERHGIKPVETDLGEWIIQLAKETPSHMIMPAIHKNRFQVAELFRKYTDEEIDENDIEKMVKIARKYLREYYFKATVGITGANVAVAETGTIGIVTNEGNGRLTTSIPPVHIVVLGYDKLVKNFQEAMKIMRVLPKNATGQIISVYVSWIKGAVDSIKNQTGKKETHFVFVDNGRLSLFDNPTVKEAFKCIRCGSCANVCPVYGVTGGHVFGHIYTGPIGVVSTAMYHGEKQAKNLLNMCTGCKACTEICPADIDIQKLISDLNAGIVEKSGLDSVKKVVFSKILNKPTTFKNVAKIGSIAAKPLTKNSFINQSVMPKKHNFRVLPSLKKHSFSEDFRALDTYLPTPFKKVLFYPGCAIEYLYPDVGISMVKLLNRLDIQVDIPDKTVCCGLPAIHSGDKQSAKKTIINNIKYMKNPDYYDNYIVLCPTCGSTIKEIFPQMLSDLPNDFKKSSAISSKLKMFSEFLDELDIKLKVKDNMKCTYHIPCHQIRGMHFSAEYILKNTVKDSFVHLPDADTCCGFGGSFSVDFPEVSSAILDKKIENILSTNADIVLTECPGCLMQIEGGLLKKGIDIKVLHLSEFFDKYVEIERQ